MLQHNETLTNKLKTCIGGTNEELLDDIEGIHKSLRDPKDNYSVKLTIFEKLAVQVPPDLFPSTRYLYSSIVSFALELNEYQIVVD